MAPIRLETGRYEGLPVNERICPICMLEVEDEEHVLMRCNFYRDQRRLMLDSVQNICQNVNVKMSMICHNQIYLYSFSPTKKYVNLLPKPAILY